MPNRENHFFSIPSHTISIYPSLLPSPAEVASSSAGAQLIPQLVRQRRPHPPPPPVAIAVAGGGAAISTLPGEGS